MPVFLDVDPRTLHLPSSRPSGADPGKLARELSQFGMSTTGMPRLFVIRDGQGRLQIIDGVTRATRAAKLCPGTLVPIEIIGDLPGQCGRLPTVGERLP